MVVVVAMAMLIGGRALRTDRRVPLSTSTSYSPSSFHILTTGGPHDAADGSVDADAYDAYAQAARLHGHKVDRRLDGSTARPLVRSTPPSPFRFGSAR